MRQKALCLEYFTVGWNVLEGVIAITAMEKIGRSVVLFIVAGLYEIGGGWLVWQWLRESMRAGALSTQP